MSARASYRPGAAQGAEVRKDAERWTLVVRRPLRHPPDRVWTALTDPDQLRQWAPFDADRSLAEVGPVTLTTVGAPKATASQTRVTRADAPALLEYRWGDQALSWELEPSESGTRLTLEHSVDRNFVAMGAAGWHLCFDVLEHLLDGEPLGRIVAGEAMKFDWPRLNEEYSKLFGVEVRKPW